MKQPPKKDYPDYYEIIKKPIDITKIINRIEEGKVCFKHFLAYELITNGMSLFQYTDFADLEKDFMLLCQNAQIYNEETSLIHEDSIVLQSVFTNAKQRLETDGDSGDDDDDNKSDTDSTVKMKIKLKGRKSTPGRRKRSAKKYVSDDDDDDDD